MRTLSHLNAFRLNLQGQLGDDGNGAFVLPNGNPNSKLFLRVIASNGEGWDHVSVSTKTRCPTWAEMAYVRELFFEPHEIAVQFGLSREGPVPYINNHPFCLHWWRAHDVAYPLPPVEFV
jgi:hypothetical protein